MSIKLNSLKPENAKAWVMLVGGLLLVLVIVFYVNKTFGGFAQLFNSIQEKLGLKDSPEDVAAKQKIADAKAAAAVASSPWSPTMYVNSPGGASISDDEAKAISDGIWDSVSWFTGGHPDEVVGAIKQVQYQVDLSLVSQWFYADHGNDLFTWITTHYDFTKWAVGGKDTMTAINDYVASLPKYV